MERRSVEHEDEHQLTDYINKHCTNDFPVLIVPRILTRRIEAQAGRFVFHTGDDCLSKTNTNDIDTAWSSLRPIVKVKPDHKRNILRELASWRIHEGTMFADLDGYAQYLAKGGL